MTEHKTQIQRWGQLAATMLVAVVLGVLLIPAGLFCATKAEAAEPGERTFDIHIAGGKVVADKRSVRILAGDTVRLRWTADMRVKLHLHGYDIETEVEPGRTSEMVFKAHATGRFPVEVHSGGGNHGGGHHHGAIMFVEVHPR